MAESRKTGGRTITTGLIPVVDFAKWVRGKNSAQAYQANTNLVTDVYLPLFGGWSGQYPGGGTMSVNLGKTANVPENLLFALGTQQKEPCAYGGRTPAGTPVTIDTYVNRAEPDPAKRNCVVLNMDMQAIAMANAAEREKILRERGHGDIRPESKGRVNVELKRPVTDSGIGFMSRNRFAVSLEKMAAQNYLMTTPGPTEKKPDNSAVAKDRMYTKEDIDKVSALFALEYERFAKQHAEHGCDGIRYMTRDSNGKLVEDKDRDVIPGTSFASLKEMGFAVAPVKGSPTAAFGIVCVDGSKDAARVRNSSRGLQAFNRAFDVHMKELIPRVNEIFDIDMSDRAKNLAMQLSIESYPRNVGGKATRPIQAENMGPGLSMGGGGAPSGGDWRPNWLSDGGRARGDVEMTILQPMAKLNVRTFAKAVTTSVEFATGKNETSADRAYGKAVLDGASTIRDYYPDGLGDRGNPDKVIQDIIDARPNATTMYTGPAGP